MNNNNQNGFFFRYSVAVLQIPIVNKILKRNAKRAAVFHSMFNVHSLLPLLAQREGAIQPIHNDTFSNPLEIADKKQVTATEPLRVDSTMFDYSCTLSPTHFHQLIHKWHEGLIDENEEELDEKHFNVQKKGKKGPKTIDSEDEDNDDDDDDRDDDANQEKQDGDERDDVHEEEEENREQHTIKREKDESFATEGTNCTTLKRKLKSTSGNKRFKKTPTCAKPSKGKAKAKKTKTKSKKRQQQPQQQLVLSNSKSKDPRVVVFQSRPFVDRFLFIPTALPVASEVVLNVSTSEFHSICRDLALGGNVLSVTTCDTAFYMSTSGEPGTVVFEFLENPFLNETPCVPFVFNRWQPQKSDSVLEGLHVPSWFRNLAVPQSFEWCNTASWSHLPTCIQRLKSIRSSETAFVQPFAQPSTSVGFSSVGVDSIMNTNSQPQHSLSDDGHTETATPAPPPPPRESNDNKAKDTVLSFPLAKPLTSPTNHFQSCYSLHLQKKPGLSSSATASITATHYLLRLLKMCTKEFSSKSLSSFPFVQLRFTSDKFLVLSLVEPVTNHGMSVHVYISPVS